jgi:ribosomal RNA methyltransferase Nop2
MDGFFVAKFKVEKRKKSDQSASRAEADEPRMMINDQGEVVEEELGKAAFDDAEDAAIIERESAHVMDAGAVLMDAESKRKHLLKTKGIKIGKDKGLEKGKSKGKERA